MRYQPANDLLNHKIILITGASDGIGRTAALTYALYGAEVILLGRNAEKVQQVKEEIDALHKHSTHGFTLDLQQATPANCQQLASSLHQIYPRLDGVLHNASILGDIVPLERLKPATWQHVMQVNVDATFYLTQALLPLLLKSKSGSLIFTTSSVGRAGRAGWGAYSVSKFATEGLMQVLSEEYKGRHLRVNCINPGATRTKMRAHAFPQEDANKLKSPLDIMPLYLYLMGDDSCSQTGISYDAQPRRPTEQRNV